MISQHLPILQVIIPLLTAPLCLLIQDRRFAWGVSLAASWTAFLIAAVLLDQTLQQGVISYELGGWSTPWGIEYRIDNVNAFVLLIVTAISSAVLLFAQRSVAREILSTRIPLFYTAYMLCLAGLLGTTITGDVFNLFVFMEISALSSYTLIALSEQRRALTAAYQYLFMGTIGATFILIGIGLLYMMTGTLNMQDLSQRLPAVTGTRTVETAFAFLTVGISIKLALVPLHLWLPNAYAYAPSVVSAFIAATTTKVAFYVLLRFMFTIFGASFAFNSMPLSFIFMALALAAIFAGSTAAIFQDNIKRLLAYSSIAQIGYMILGISFTSVTGLTAAILHLFNHALMKGALFLALGCVSLSPRHGKHGTDCVASAPHALDDGGLCDRRSEPHRRTADRRLHQQMVSGCGPPWNGAGGRSPWQYWWARCCALVYVWRVVEVAYLPGPIARACRRNQGGTALDAAADLGVDYRQSVFRYRHQPDRWRSLTGGTATARGH